MHKSIIDGLGVRLWLEQLSATIAKSPALVPLRTTALAPKGKFAVPVLVIVSICVAEV